jgi:hypothetical protein
MECSRLADEALKCVPVESMAGYAIRIARVLLRWFPDGEMVMWAKNVNYFKDQRFVSLLATAAFLGFDAVEESLQAGLGNMWNAGEDIFSSHPGTLYLDLTDTGTMGLAFETIPLIFLFEFGAAIQFPPFDAVSISRLHSLPDVNYQGGPLQTHIPVIRTSRLAQEGLREWFLAGYNRLAQHLIRWENFRTLADELRPGVQQQVSMTIGRVLNATAHLFVSSAVSAQLADFWDILDLYAGMRGGDPANLLDRRFLESKVSAAIATISGDLRDVLSAHVRSVYGTLVADCIAGITQPSRVQPDQVLIGPTGRTQPVPHPTFFARHLGIRRNTLHGYDIRNTDEFRDFLAIHDGRLPDRLPEWARYLLFVLLATPSAFLDRYQRLPT